MSHFLPPSSSNVHRLILVIIKNGAKEVPWQGYEAQRIKLKGVFYHPEELKWLWKSN